MNNICVFPGSFDPVTKGHINMIKRASKLFDKVYVAILVNSSKTTMFDKGQRIKMLKASLKGMDNVSVDSFDGLLVDYAKKVKADTILRGVRNAADFEYEYEMYMINSELSSDIDTVFMPADKNLAHISSSAVRELLYFGKDIKAFVPDGICEYIYNGSKND